MRTPHGPALLKTRLWTMPAAKTFRGKRGSDTLQTKGVSEGEEGRLAKGAELGRVGGQHGCVAFLKTIYKIYRQ